MYMLRAAVTLQGPRAAQSSKGSEQGPRSWWGGFDMCLEASAGPGQARAPRAETHCRHPLQEDFSRV